MRFTHYRILEAEAEKEEKAPENEEKQEKGSEESEKDSKDSKSSKKSEFNQSDYVKDAEEWLKDKFGDKFTFKHVENLSAIGKTYHASINDKEFMISGKSFDTTGDNEIDTVLYRIDTIEEEPVPDEPMF